MSSLPSNDPVVQQLQLLLTGYGYNFYNSVNQARSDDLLVRERASYYLAQTGALLSTLASDYQFRFIPPLTRANPDPPQEALLQIRLISQLQERVSQLETQIRGMATPAQDRIWWRFRQEQALLLQLLNFDLALVRLSEQIYQQVAQMTPESWNSQGDSPVRPLLQQLTQAVQERARLLLLPL